MGIKELKIEYHDDWAINRSAFSVASVEMADALQIKACNHSGKEQFRWCENETDWFHRKWIQII